MKYKLLSIVATTFVLTLFIAQAPATETTTTEYANPVVLAVENMTCASCPYMVKRSLESIEGVTTTAIELEGTTAIVTVQYDPSTSKVEHLIEATKAIGFPSTIIGTN